MTDAPTIDPSSFDFDAILLDIEGATTPLTFVHETLFPFAAENVDNYLRDNWDDPGVQEDVAALRELAEAEADAGVEGATRIPSPDEASDEEIRSDTLAVIGWLMSEDRKATGLKSLQGRIWRHGYVSGELRGALFDDVVEAFERWRDAGIPIAIFSSGSVEAQKLLFGYSQEGDLTPYISAYFDTNTGSKKSSDSYRKIARALETSPERILFLTDKASEADAARDAGFQTAVMDRPGNKPQREHTHPILKSFEGLGA